MKRLAGIASRSSASGRLLGVMHGSALIGGESFALVLFHSESTLTPFVSMSATRNYEPRLFRWQKLFKVYAAGSR